MFSQHILVVYLLKASQCKTRHDINFTNAVDEYFFVHLIDSWRETKSALELQRLEKVLKSFSA